MRHPILIAVFLSFGAAVALGLSRFSYGLLLLPMRADLGWSYLLAGAMNTGNAFGYFLGALVTPSIIRRVGPQRLMIIGAVLTGAFMLLSGFVTHAGVLLFQRVLAGISSAFIFIAGGVLAAHLGALRGKQVGLLLGLYYGGTGVGIVLSAIVVPITLTAAQIHGASHAWQWAWYALGAICFLATLLMRFATSSIPQTSQLKGGHDHFKVRLFGFGLTSYFLFGVGYIGYMTFIVALLKEQGMRPSMITLFYTALGIAVMASSFIWARMLDYFKGGQTLAILNGLLGVATLLPVLTVSTPVLFISGILFGGVFLSVVSSATALVRHNLPSAAWSAGISVFTIAFALGQIAGPTVTGWIADGPGGLATGFVFSALVLFAGAALALCQRALLPITDAVLCD
ncbi:YbfB/YjiJ family MFS transporter [Glaciimonas immobilis]|uniref:Putative MFS family arabinose efflux permease n=1 Tax=Glaciimonas immobilis TaxID=728004 RepID=A0A840RWW9_9BURK|nr:YbfB/YjiJ family MFS transporter [Glaciimonas immobilis]KAF3996579.1 YbfB/YjiJ family MFS transporter [Glaciimonas immobilis]MBB5201051.1 putative MFS family arabinose efflux permease [Glaciimonas immobilis]